jgi:hypothetical protein
LEDRHLLVPAQQRREVDVSRVAPADSRARRDGGGRSRRELRQFYWPVAAMWCQSFDVHVQRGRWEELGDPGGATRSRMP